MKGAKKKSTAGTRQPAAPPPRAGPRLAVSGEQSGYSFCFDCCSLSGAFFG